MTGYPGGASRPCDEGAISWFSAGAGVPVVDVVPYSPHPKDAEDARQVGPRAWLAYAAGPREDNPRTRQERRLWVSLFRALSILAHTALVQLLLSLRQFLYSSF